MENRLTRRDFLKTVGIGSGAVAAAFLGGEVLNPKLTDAHAEIGEWRWVENDPITSEWAAENLGQDSWSRNPENWRENKYGGVMLTPKPDDTTSRVLTAGTNVEGWLKPARVGHKHQAVALSAYGGPGGQDVLEINSGSFWKPREQREGDAFWHWFNLHNQVVSREAKEQPDVFVLTLGCPSLDPSNFPYVETERDIPVEWFASQLGMDEWSQNPENWELNQYGGAMLRARPDDTTCRVKLNGVNVDGWIKPKKVEHQHQAVALSAYGGPGGQDVLEINSGSFWKPRVIRPGDEFVHWLYLNEQFRRREEVEQPDVVILNVGCPLPIAECPEEFKIYLPSIFR